MGWTRLFSVFFAVSWCYCQYYQLAAGYIPAMPDIQTFSMFLHILVLLSQRFAFLEKFLESNSLTDVGILFRWMIWRHMSITWDVVWLSVEPIYVRSQIKRIIKEIDLRKIWHYFYFKAKRFEIFLYVIWFCLFTVHLAVARWLVNRFYIVLHRFFL